MFGVGKFEIQFLLLLPALIPDFELQEYAIYLIESEIEPTHSSKEMEAKMKPFQPQKYDLDDLIYKFENQSTEDVFNGCHSKQHYISTSLLQSVPTSTSSSKKNVTEEDIQIVQNLIERCLLKYMNRNEVIKTLCDQECIDPVFTTLVWQKLEEQNPEFFRNYKLRLELIKQISTFNTFLGWLYDMMQNLPPPNSPVTPRHNRLNPMPANNLPVLHAEHSPQSAGINFDKVTETGSVETAPVIPSSSGGDTTTLDGIFLALPDVTDPSNLADIGNLENCPRSPYLPSYQNIDSPALLMRYFTNLDTDDGNP